MYLFYISCVLSAVLHRISAYGQYRYIPQNEDYVVIQILVIKPTRNTNFSNLFLEQNSTCFGEYLCPSSGVQHCTHSNRYRSYRLCCLFASGIRMELKHVESYFKNKFEKLVLLPGFIIRTYHDARSSECQIIIQMFVCNKRQILT